MDPKIKEKKKTSGLQGKGLPNGDRKAVVGLMIGSNLLSVGVKYYLLSRMASRLEVTSYFSDLCLSPNHSGLPF